MSSLSSPPPEPDLYAGKYRLVREIGRGGMGSVYEAVEVALDRTVAVKRIPATGGTLEARQRFRREVVAAAKLSHPGIAQVLGFGAKDDAEYYIAMELVLGESLRSELARASSARDVFALFDQMLAVLAYAHARGVYHLDLKPENILVARVGSAPICKLLDFGVARTDTALPESTEIVGTPRYMAPEQVRGELAGPAADLYAVGVMLFEALTGLTPIGGGGEEVMERKLRYVAPSLDRTLFGPASAELNRLLEQLLERDPTSRLASAADARTGLAACPEAGDIAPHSVRPVSVRPSAEPETIRVARGLTDMGFARVLPFVGRQDERGRLADSLASVAARATARVVVIEGPTGIGKTHLLEWFVRQVREEGGRSVTGASYVEGGGPEGDALRAAIERHVGAVGKGREAVARTVSRFLTRFGGADAEEAAALVDFLRPRSVGEGDAPASRAPRAGSPGRRTHTLALVERVLRRAADARPVVLYLDDVHLGGAGAFEAISFFLAMWRQTPAPILLLAAVTTPLEDRDLRHAYRKLLAHEGDQVVRITLDPLPPGETSKLVAAVLDDAGTPVAQSIAARSAGNPLFTIQLARLARDSPAADRTGAISDKPPSGGVASSRRMRGADLPPSVQQLLEARIDAAVLHASDRDLALRMLSMIAAFLPPTPTTLLERALIEDGVRLGDALATLDQLVATGIVRELLDHGIEAVDFDHPLVAEVLRARMTSRMLRRDSLKALELKETHYKDDERVRVLHELAEHAFIAGLDDRARELALRAAQQAYDAGRYTDATYFVRRLVETLATPSADGGKARSELALLASRIADETGDARFAESVLAPTQDGDDAVALEAALALGRSFARTGRVSEAQTAVERAEQILAAQSERGEAAPVAARQEHLRLRASIARRTGRAAEAANLLESALAADADTPAPIARLLYDNLAWAFHRAGDRASALASAQRALELAAPGFEQGWALRSVAVLGDGVLPLEERREQLERALAIAQEAGALRLLASALTHLANLDHAQGDQTAAMGRYRQAVQIGSDYVDHDDLSECSANLAMLLIENGLGAEAVIVLADRPPSRSTWELGLRLVAAALTAATHDVESALAEALAVRAGADELPACWGVTRAADRLARAFADAGHDDLAAWAGTQAASLAARAGEREPSARGESLRPLEDVFETTRRET